LGGELFFSNANIGEKVLIIKAEFCHQINLPGATFYD
jgi:hypothetical protein